MLLPPCLRNLRVWKMDVETLIAVVEMIGVVSFAISGAVVGIDKEMDIFGVLMLSVFTSFGGGMIRDLLIGREVAFFGSLLREGYVLVCALTSVAVFILASLFKGWYMKNEHAVMRVNNYIDALGIGAFSVSSVRVCIGIGGSVAEPFFAICMGVITAVGGGMIRDVCMRDIPFFFRKHIYAVAALCGASLYYVLTVYAFPGSETADMISAVLAMVLVFVIRALATVFRWNLPRAISFSRMENGAHNSDEKAKEDEQSNAL